MLEKLENMEKECFFEEKTFPSFKIASLPNCEGAKYAGGSRPSCYSILQRYILTIAHMKFHASSLEFSIHFILLELAKPKFTTALDIPLFCVAD